MNSTTKQDISFQELLAKLMRFCSYQERSEWEVKQKALDYGLGELEFDDLLKQLREENFIDENRFAETFVRGKVKVKRWGIYKIKQGLTNKGVSSGIISTALKSIDLDLYLSNLEQLAESKQANLSESKTDRAKLYRYLLSKGYESEYIYSIMNKKD